MNRPSRNDDTIDHPTWNQNPPFLAPDLTTCADLNGMANEREHRSRKGNGAAGQSGMAVMDHPPSTESTPPTRDVGPDDHLRGQRSIGFCPLSKETLTFSATEHPVAAASLSPVGRRSKAVLSWIPWGLSVIATSILLNLLGDTTYFRSFWPSELHFATGGNGTLSFAHMSALDTATQLHVLSPPLSKRATCGSGGPAQESDYNTPLHVGALVIVLVVSTLACALSMIMRQVPNFKIPANFFFAVRHFGTGVLIATAFVHLLPTAFTYLGDPCLSGFWTTDYPAMPGAIALAGIFFVAIIEMVFSPHRHIFPRVPVGPSATLSRTGRGNDEFAESNTGMESSQTHSFSRANTRPVRDMGPLRGRSVSISRQLSRVEQVGSSDMPHQASTSKQALDVEEGSLGKFQLTAEQQHKKDILQCMLLEMGILFHSVFIGMALSVSTGKEFVILLIAIVFHQSFEGLALGARIASIDWPKRTWQPWMMALAYGCTTPVGQAIGLGVHSLYDPYGELGLILVGTMNAVSSGLLVFASLVELLSEDFLSDESWVVLRGKRRVVACMLVFGGAAGMSLIGAWA